MRYFSFLLVWVLLASCEPYNNDDLAGNWKTVSLTEEGDSMAVDLSAIGFYFSPDGRYHYNSTLNYQEAGRYHLDGNYLMSTDTTRANQEEKAVEIMQLVNDSLILRMKERNKERIAVMVKE